jgi:heme-degrading monooxygenase HmoA
MTDDHSRPPPKIARIWRGRVTTARADEYESYLLGNMQALRDAALAVEVFREDRPGESDFVVISYWESVEAMSRFAGKDPRRIHHLQRDKELLIELPEGVQVLDIRWRHRVR